MEKGKAVAEGDGEGGGEVEDIFAYDGEGLGQVGVMVASCAHMRTPCGRVTTVQRGFNPPQRDQYAMHYYLGLPTTVCFAL